ncbi:glycosyltransferase family 39 protein, partial [bacterium]|nr:glycosyltransferase family 39 protein [candidate division CSSED10-310 bacterium]
MESTDRWEETTVRSTRNWLLVILFLVGLGLRFHGFDWGFPHHFHPDERQIVDFQTPQVKLDVLNPVVSLPLLVRGEWSELRRKVDLMNTKFFAYGPLPMYSLAVTVHVQDRVNQWIQKKTQKMELSPQMRQRVLEWFPRVDTGKGRIVTGRVLSALVSALTILVVFRLGRTLYDPKVAALAAALFTFTVLSIQQGHFMVVDGPQTFLVAWAMVYLVRVAVGDRRRDYYYAGILIGLAMATKFSTAPIGLAYIIAHGLSMTRGRRRGVRHWGHWVAGGLVAVAMMTLVMPFWIIDSQEFFRDIREQRNMVMGVADLPYTIQFEGTSPFVYMIRNMIQWSMGIPLGLAAFIGFFASIRRIWKKPGDIGNIVVLSFVLPLLYFNGTFYAKFLRYTLVILPFMTIFAARWLIGMKNWAGRSACRWVTGGVLIGTVGWAAAFQTIYLDPHTRLQASDWVYANVEKGMHIVQESGWDDALPVTTENGNVGRYETRQLGIYREPDNDQRARAMADVLEWGDVVILSSRKHYGSVCRVPNRYPVSSNFYKLLFDEKLGYQHVKTFDNPPALGPLVFRDDLADESFRVYEHPRVDIFVKEQAIDQERLAALLIAPPIETADMTYTDMMTRRPPTEIGSRVNHPIIRWLFILELLGVICLPLAFILFNQFDHKGYPFAKIMGLLILGYACWIIPSLRWLPFSRTLIVAGIIFLAGINYLVYQRFKTAIHAFVRDRWWSITGYELLFLTVFALFGVLKSYNPDIYWSESLMDFGFLNAVLRADYFPPEDPWMQGQGVNYYYYGHYLAGMMTRLTGVEPHYGYNLFFITIPALVALSIAAVLIALTRRIWVGLLGVIFAIIIGNLDGLPQAANIWVRSARSTAMLPYADAFQSFIGSFLNLGRQDAHFRFFRSAHELIKPTVHEFPFWSYNFMDLHAHTMATMLSTFFIALQLVLLRHRARGIHLFGDHPLQIGITLSTMCITYGAMISTNSWDVPTQLILLVLISLW